MQRGQYLKSVLGGTLYFAQCAGQKMRVLGRPAQHRPPWLQHWCSLQKVGGMFLLGCFADYITQIQIHIQRYLITIPKLTTLTFKIVIKKTAILKMYKNIQGIRGEKNFKSRNQKILHRFPLTRQLETELLIFWT